MIKVTDVAFVRFRVPDLEKMGTFLYDFGFVEAARESEVIYSRGTDADPYLHVAARGEPGFAGVAFDVASAEDLKAVSEFEGASPIEDLDGPGGGKRVRLKDPDGFVVELVHGREVLSRLPVRRGGPINTGSAPIRFGTFQRLEAGPAQVKRLGHCVLNVGDYKTSRAWYGSRFGFRSSDDIYMGEKDNVILSFLRCDRGETYVDHHSLLCIGTGTPGFDHAAFEVEDYDALMLGHDRLVSGGYEHQGGIGRHILGSQVFDYWKDPWGHVIEHFTDGDLLNADTETGLFGPDVALGTQWGQFNP